MFVCRAIAGRLDRGPALEWGEQCGVVALATSTYEGHTCAMLQGGAVYCWGQNSYGKLGDGTEDDSSVPVAVKLP